MSNNPQLICSICGTLSTQVEKDRHQNLDVPGVQDPHPGENWDLVLQIPTDKK